ncbi:MAG: SAM-dependent chlorinase/fluorinase [Microthrixaceae bacterium]
MAFRCVSLLSDYGLQDEFVGVVHSVLKALAPGVEVVDITHGISPYDVRGGSLALARSVQYMCPGIVMALVDPGVGSERRPVAVEVGDGASVLLGPDNGILAPAVSMVGGATRAVVLDDPSHHLEAPGPTFDGRDVFAPVAASLCRGTDLGELGTEIDPGSLLPGTLPLSRVEADGIHTEVLWVDRFGNVQLNLDPEELEDHPEQVELSFSGRRTVAARARSFSSLPVGGLGLMVDSYGLVALVANQSSASEETGLGPGDEVLVVPGDASAAAAEGDSPGVEIPVQLGTKRSPGGPSGQEPQP